MARRILKRITGATDTPREITPRARDRVDPGAERDKEIIAKSLDEQQSRLKRLDWQAQVETRRMRQ